MLVDDKAIARAIASSHESGVAWTRGTAVYEDARARATVEEDVKVWTTFPERASFALSGPRGLLVSVVRM